MARVSVRCTVRNCHYFGAGNVCNASEILITSDEVGQRYPQDVDVQQLSTVLEDVGETPARHCEETCCKTFRG